MSSKPIRILQFLRKMQCGGIETWLMNVLRKINRNRFHFTFCTTSEEQGFYEEEILSLGAQRIACPLRNGFRSFNHRFTSILKEGQFDIVHSHMLLFSGWIMRLAASAKVPVRIAHMHSTGDRHSDSLRRNLYRWLMRKLIKKYCTFGVACSKMAADYGFPRNWVNLPHYDVIYCGVDALAFSATPEAMELRRSFGIPQNERVIGHVGNFVQVKNHEFLLHVVAAIASKRQDIHLLLVGDGPLRSEIEALANNLGIASKITFGGMRDDVPLLMSSLFDLLIFPSVLEGLGLVVVEAQCAGIPVLVSDIIPLDATIIKELVHRESLGKAPHVWAKRAIELLEQPHYDKDVARSQVENSVFSISHSVDFFEKLYSGRL